MKTAEIKEFTDQELKERIDLEREQLTRLRLNHAVSPLDNPLKIRDIRRNVARLMTELRNRQLQNK
jgi:large subunit ribosomal protein L29